MGYAIDKDTSKTHTDERRKQMTLDIVNGWITPGYELMDMQTLDRTLNCVGRAIQSACNSEFTKEMLYSTMIYANRYFVIRNYSTDRPGVLVIMLLSAIISFKYLVDGADVNMNIMAYITGVELKVFLGMERSFLQTLNHSLGLSEVDLEMYFENFTYGSTQPCVN